MLCPQPGFIWRALTGTLALGLGWKPVRTIIFGRGADAVRRLEWQPDGQWRVSDAARKAHVAELSPASATLGPWLLLIWSTPGQRRRLHALIDSACTDPKAFRALKGRLNC
jgi:hypothetical protein